jgi:signal transduction histidine kinase
MINPRVTGLKLRQQLILTSMVPLVLMSIGATLLSTYVLLQASLPLILQENTSRAQTIAADAATNLNFYMHMLETTGIALARYSGDPRQQQQTLQDFSPYLVRFNSVILLDKAGNVVASTPNQENWAGQNYASTEYFQLASSRRLDIFSGVVQMQSANQDAVVIAVPVLHDGDLEGVILGVLFLKSHDWAKDLGPSYSQTGMRVMLVDVSGNIIYSTDSTHGEGSLISNARLWKMVQVREPSSLLSGKNIFANTDVISFAPLPGMYWNLVIQEHFAAVNAMLSSYQAGVLAPLLVGIIFLLAVLFISVNRISKPVMALAKQANHVSVGDPIDPLKAEGPIELQTLTNNFNQIVNRLKDQHAVLQQYAAMVLQSQEEERKRVAREMHDEIVQTIVGLVQRIQLCRGMIESNPDLAKDQLDAVQHLANTIIEDVRRICDNLRPIILEDLGLSAALQALCDELALDMPGTSVQFEILGEEERLDAEVELTVFRVTQEALTNIRKHALEATKIIVRLFYELKGVSVSIQDNGPGLQNTDTRILVQQRHLGVAGMQERARLFGGKVEMIQNLGGGTVVILFLPYERDFVQETIPQDEGFSVGKLE